MSEPGRLAIVTGTSSGIGEHVARQLLTRGWTVVGMSRRPAPIDAAGYRHVAVDLGDLRALQRIILDDLAPLVADGRWTRIGLVNNGAAIGSLRALEDADPVAFANVLAVNTVAPVALMGMLTRHANAQVPLRIVNVSTGAATAPLPGVGEYGASKAALRLAGMTCAAELSSPERVGGVRRNVGILSYSPGVVDTPMQVSARAPRPWNTMFVNFHASGQLVQPDGPAREIVEYLESERADPSGERRYGGR